MLKGLSEGRIVHYVLSETDLPPSQARAIGRHRPAIVVNSWPNLGRDDGYSNLVVFLDGTNDMGTRIMEVPTTLWATSRVMS